MSNFDPPIRITGPDTTERTVRDTDTMADATIEDFLTGETGSAAEMARATLLLRVALGGGRCAAIGDATPDSEPTGPGGLTPQELRDFAGFRRLHHSPEVRAAIPSRRVRRRRWPLVAVAAAAVAVLTISIDQARHLDVPHRSAAAAAALQLGEVRLNEGDARLGWSAVPFAAVYEVTVFDSTGSLLLTETTRDTVVAVAALDLPREGPVFWRVRARVEAGRWIDSRMGEFRVDGMRR